MGYLETMDDDELEAVCAIVAELNRAQEKHPDWPKDLIHQSAIIAEESGELTRACLHEQYEKGSFNNCIEEAKQTGAMALRFIIQR